MTIRATARIQITLEVEAAAWGEDSPIGQLYKQASREAIERVRKLITDTNTSARIIGEPKVIGVITEQ